MYQESISIGFALSQLSLSSTKNEKGAGVNFSEIMLP